MTGPLVPWRVALELSKAVRQAACRLPSARRRERATLEAVSAQAIHLINTGKAWEMPPRDQAFQHFKDALKTALEAGVSRHELVIAFQGDDGK